MFFIIKSTNLSNYQINQNIDTPFILINQNNQSNPQNLEDILIQHELKPKIYKANNLLLLQVSRGYRSHK